MPQIMKAAVCTDRETIRIAEVATAGSPKGRDSFA